MRKERNSFFNEAAYNYMNMNQYNPPVNNFPSMEATSSFYMNQNYSNNPSSFNDFQTRLARIERQVNKLEARVNKLENSPVNNISESTDINSNSNMYMI